MKKYVVSINGVSYEVGVDQIDNGPTAAPKAKPSSVIDFEERKVKAAENKPAAAEAANGSKSVTAPMPGTILSINKKVGDSVKAGDILCTLEAMKMENEIQSGCDGVISGINVNSGDTVSSGQVLFLIQ